MLQQGILVSRIFILQTEIQLLDHLRHPFFKLFMHKALILQPLRDNCKARLHANYPFDTSFCSAAAGTSGVIAVVIFGLYGSANAKWGMSSAVTESPVFDTFWDTISFMLNGIVFFYAGASSVNFFWRSSEVRQPPPALQCPYNCIVYEPMTHTSQAQGNKCLEACSGGLLPCARPRSPKGGVLAH